MKQFLRTLAVLAALMLGISPVVSAAGHCQMAMQSGEAASANGADMPCCPDMAAGKTCQVGCVQLVPAPVPLQTDASPCRQNVTPVLATDGTDWIGPQETDPPRRHLRS